MLSPAKANCYLQISIKNYREIKYFMHCSISRFPNPIAVQMTQNPIGWFSFKLIPLCLHQSLSIWDLFWNKRLLGPGAKGIDKKSLNWMNEVGVIMMVMVGLCNLYIRDYGIMMVELLYNLEVWVSMLSHVKAWYFKARVRSRGEINVAGDSQ